LQAVVTFFRGSSLNTAALERVQADVPAARRVHLMRDCSTRWNSTFIMLKRFLALLPALRHLRTAIDNHEEEELAGFMDIMPTVEMIELCRMLDRVRIFAVDLWC
jgi:hypothetical protein